MYCSSCGKEIKDGSAFCSECGAAQTRSKNFQGYQSQDNRYWEGTNIPYNTMCIIGLVISGVSLFFSFAGLAGIGGFILSRMGFNRVVGTGERGKELAIVGMVIGGITAAYGVIMLLASLSFMSSIFSMF